MYDSSGDNEVARSEGTGAGVVEGGVVAEVGENFGGGLGGEEEARGAVEVGC